jgi:hypothetical protein
VRGGGSVASGDEGKRKGKTGLRGERERSVMVFCTRICVMSRLHVANLNIYIS